MTARAVFYLERDVMDGQLKQIGDLGDQDHFQLGGLFVLTSESLPEEAYSIQAYVGDRVVQDRITRIGSFSEGTLLYRLEFTESRLRRPIRAYFLLECTFELMEVSQLAWAVRELDPETFDMLEREFGYNILGATRIQE